MPDFSANSPRRNLPRQLWLVLAVVALLAQTLGLLHRIAHAPQRELAHAHLASSATQVVAASPPSAQPDVVPLAWLQRLFAGEADTVSCELYDQLIHADLLHAQLVGWLAQVQVSAVPPWHAHWQLAAQAVGFLARGPPPRSLKLYTA